jgi:hypothetical protein
MQRLFDSDKDMDTALAREREAVELEEQHRYQQFLSTPQGRARAAAEADSPVFQVVAHTEGVSVRLFGSHAVRHEEVGLSEVLAGIEAEGWSLAHAGFVYVPAHDTAYGDVLGTYLFRRLARSSSE